MHAETVEVLQRIETILQRIGVTLEKGKDGGG